MTPQMKVRITAQNDSASGFGQVVKDANAASSAVVTAGNRANASLRSQSNALALVGKSSAAAANQQRNLVFQLNDMAVSLAGGANPLMVFAQQGSQIATIYGPEEGGLGKALKETANLAVGLVTKFWPIAAVVGAGTAAIGGMTAAINAASDTQVSFGDVAMATWQVFADGVYNLVQPAILAVGGWFSDMWNLAWPVIKGAGNAIVGTFKGAFDAVTTVWGNLPAIFGDIFTMAMNGAIDIVQNGINGIIGPINGLMTSVGLGPLELADLSGFKGEVSGAAGKAAGQISGAFQDALGVDYLGQLFDAITGKAVALAKATDDAGKAAKGAGENMKPFNLGLEAANDNAEKLTKSLANDLTQGVMSVWQAFRAGENVLEAIGKQLLDFVDMLLSNTVQNFFSSLLGGFGFGGAQGGLGWSYGLGTYADGTDFHPGGMAIVGERGPELVSLPRGSSVATASETAAMFAGASSEGGQTRILVELSPALVGQILQQAANQTVELIRSQAPLAVATAQRNGGF